MSQAQIEIIEDATEGLVKSIGKIGLAMWKQHPNAPEVAFFDLKITEDGYSLTPNNPKAWGYESENTLLNTETTFLSDSKFKDFFSRIKALQNNLPYSAFPMTIKVHNERYLSTQNGEVKYSCVPELENINFFGSYIIARQENIKLAINKLNYLDQVMEAGGSLNPETAKNRKCWISVSGFTEHEIENQTDFYRTGISKIYAVTKPEAVLKSLASHFSLSEIQNILMAEEAPEYVNDFHKRMMNVYSETEMSSMQALSALQKTVQSNELKP